MPGWVNELKNILDGVDNQENLAQSVDKLTEINKMLVCRLLQLEK